MRQLQKIKNEIERNFPQNGYMKAALMERIVDEALEYISSKLLRKITLNIISVETKTIKKINARNRSIRESEPANG